MFYSLMNLLNISKNSSYFFLNDGTSKMVKWVNIAQKFTDIQQKMYVKIQILKKNGFCLKSIIFKLKLLIET